jgi:predicted O-linked N-acetylglucosamine transferase (SPINDLY family)
MQQDIQLALRHLQGGRVAEAQEIFQQMAGAAPADPLLLHGLGVLGLQLGHESQGVALLEQSARLRTSAGVLIDLGAGYRRVGRSADAERCYRRALELEPGHADAVNNLGNLLREAGKLREAEQCYRRALELRPQFAKASRNLGNVLDEQGDQEQAERHLRAALELEPADADGLNDLGNVLQKLERNEEAERSYRRALELRPGFADAQANLGAALRGLGRPDEAERCVRRALALRPDHAQSHHNLGIALEDLGRMTEAEASYRKALALKPGYADACTNLGALLLRAGRLAEAEEVMRNAVALEPDSGATHSNLIFAMDLIEGIDVARQQAERRRWYERHGRRHASGIRPHANAPDPQRKLRVGYVSADFRRHSACYAFAPVIRGHDRTQFEVLCYSDVRREDNMTARLKGAVSAWRSTLRLSDDALAEQVRRDGIDILVDLSGHSAGNRLAVFARKPAPVQVTAWGHATGTGLATMDYFLADPVLVPPQERALYAERIVDLPSALCYEPPAYLPAPGDLPALRADRLVFGCVNRLEKVTDRAIGLWGRILAGAPRARLLLKDKPLSDAGVSARFLQRLQQAGGIESSRVTLLGGSAHAEHLKVFLQIDVGLDPFPQGGGVSTAEALWMGVPIVTMRGHTAPSRIAASFLTVLGMQDWIASGDEDYVRIALQAGQDLSRLSALRQALRARASASPCGDLHAYVRAVEQAYRVTWRRWCEQT